MHPSRSYFQRIGVEGALLTLTPAPFLLTWPSAHAVFPPHFWRIMTASTAAVACLLAAYLFFRRPSLGKFWGSIALATTTATALPLLAGNPFTALLGGVTVISAGFALHDFPILVDERRPSSHAARCRQRACWSSATLVALASIILLVNPPPTPTTSAAIAVSAGISQILCLQWCCKRKSDGRFPVCAAGTAMVLLAILVALGASVPAAVLLLGMVNLLLLSTASRRPLRSDQWWEPLLGHPARLLFTTFLTLCLTGALLLQLPGATRTGGISLIDALFTSVSAVCVTGLTVLDTPAVFSRFGQFLILLLIQLGGLGIMSITTVALHVMGRRLSLRHERVLASITDTDRPSLVASLITILKFTLAAEAAGALILSGLFATLGDPPGAALWRGIFTAVSAFCNAGFALQSDNLVPYQHQPLILHTVALLIILGGLAPATCLLMPRWLGHRPVPIAAAIALATTTILLFAGAFFILILEWHGALNGLPLADKLHNAWFQSVTLRTAGFNSIDINHVAGPTYLIMICLMFIGGSPGGTAGGVKTTTIGILALTFVANVCGRDEVVSRNRHILPGTINRAITIIVAGVLVWFTLVLMLEVTQQVPAREIVFEVTSALGTVGLTIGATGKLDGIGKLIIIIGMFAG
ncbi:MAG: potassium transporter TrkG, partial [Thermodesulfobacteriota bacterium]